MFQPIYCCFKKIGNSKHIPAWKSKVLPDKSIKPPTTSNNSLSPALNYISGKIRVKHAGSCWRLTFNHKTLVNIYIVYEINLWPFKQRASFTSREFLFGAVKLLIFININILDMVLDLIHMEVFRYLMVVGLVKI